MYQEFIKQSSLPRVHGQQPYSACAQNAFALSEGVLDALGIRAEHVEYVVEHGDRRHELEQSFDEYRSHEGQGVGRREIAFSPKGTIGLEPADLIVGEINRTLLRAFQAIGTLTNGLHHTRAQEFKPWAPDQVAREIIALAQFALVCNRSGLRRHDRLVGDVFDRAPQLLAIREKASSNQGRRRERQAP